MKKNIVIVLGILIAATNAGYSATKGVTSRNISKSAKAELTVAAAADLTKAFAEIGANFEKANNCKINFSFGSTGTLSQQIANGAPFDVFAAANISVIDELDAKGCIISNTKRLYAIGRIGIVTLKASKIKAKTLKDLLKPEIKKIAIANPEHAPYGLAAKQTLIKAGLWDKLEPKLVYGKNISDTLTFVTTRNADVGFISLSLDDKKTLDFNLIDAKLHAPLKQAMAVIKGAKEKELGLKFIKFIKSKKGNHIMRKYGFVTPEE